MKTDEVGRKGVLWIAVLKQSFFDSLLFYFIFTLIKNGAAGHFS